MEREMKSIWYFVGLILLTMGAVVFLSGVYYFFFPDGTKTVLQELHPDLWWGAVMMIAGAIFYFASRGKKIKEETK
jgi:uncharacterized protein YjeT (DUF2065 family)